MFKTSESGHIPGTPMQETQSRSGEQPSAQVQYTVGPVTPRLLDLYGSAGYLSISSWTVRTLEQQGILNRVRIPFQNHGEVRKLLFDKSDLDHLIDCWKDARG